MATPQIIQIHDVKNESTAGKKVASLAKLAAMQLYVPSGFTIVGASVGNYPEKLEQNYLALGGGEVAVRISMIDALEGSSSKPCQAILTKWYEKTLSPL